MSRSQRTKGHAFERQVARRLRDEGWPDARRGFQTREGSEQCDVEGTGYWLEAKADERIAIRAALKQGLADTDGRPVVVVLKRNRKPWVVAMPFGAGGSEFGPFSRVVEGKRPRIPWDLVFSGEAVLVRELRADAVPSYALVTFEAWVAWAARKREEC